MSRLTPERKRAFRVMEWANLNGDDLAGVLRLDPDDDADLLAVIDDALLAAGDAWYALAALDKVRAERDRLLTESRIGETPHFCFNDDCGTVAYGRGYDSCPSCGDMTGREEVRP